jgi:YfiH family protein
MITAEDLKLDGIAHGFFTREGGHSSGLYASLNCGLGSGDDGAKVRHNRSLVEKALGVGEGRLVSAYQVHGTDVAVVTRPFEERPKVDAMVTNVPGLALGVLTADCGPILFADPKARVIGAAHAGWKGALLGVHRTTVEAMEKLGAARANVIAVLGPTISQENYEVGPDFPAAFVAGDPANAAFFRPSPKPGHHLFDLPAFLAASMHKLGLGKVVNLGLCTYADEDWFFSFRRTTHRAEPDYGRQISAIALRD